MTDAGALDVLTDLPERTGTRLTYEALVERAQPQDIAGVRIRRAALEDIIASKEWANRAKDHEALPELYATRDAQAAAERAQTGFPKPARGLARPTRVRAPRRARGITWA